MKTVASILCALALAAASPVGATVYNVGINTSLGLFMGTITTSPDPDPTYDLVTNLTGTFNQNPVTLLAPGTFVGNDNLFSPASPYVDGHGLAFSAGGVDYDIFNSFAFAIVSNNEGSGNVSTVIADELSSGVPEPATWLTMLLGFGAMGFVLRARRRPGKSLTIS